MSANQEQQIDTVTDEYLFKDFLAGSNSAARELFKRYNTKLFRYSVGLLKSADAAEDITQEIWEKIIYLRQKPLAVRM